MDVRSCTAPSGPLLLLFFSLSRLVPSCPVSRRSVLFKSERAHVCSGGDISPMLHLDYLLAVSEILHNTV